MKKSFSILAVILFLGSSVSAIDTIELGIMQVSDPVLVQVSTSAYTNVTPSAIRLRYMTAVLIDSWSANPSILHGHIGNCTSTSISTSTVQGPIEIAAASNGGAILLPQDMCIWMVSRATIASTMTVQGVSQRR